MENALYILLVNQQRKRVPVNFNAIQKKARVLYGHFKQGEPSTGSCSSFAAGEAASADQFAASSYLEQFKDLVEEKGFRSEQILNADK
ncbi:Jerky protein [Trichinella pseudospiralis]